MKQIALAVVAVVVAATVAWALSTGPIDSVTGAPGEATCNQTGCHNTLPLNSGGGVLTLTPPGTYAPSQVIPIAINLSKSGQSRWGFEITVLTATNQPAGTLIVTDVANTQKSTAPNGRQYIKHTAAGTFSGTFHASPGWSVNWQAPPTLVGPVTFYVAGNAASNDASSGFDYIYTTSATVTEVNVSPTLTGIGAKTVVEGQTLSVGVTASDQNLTTPQLAAFGLPGAATFTDSGNGAGGFVYQTDSTQVGVHAVLFVASDGILADSETVVITVTKATCCIGDAGNVDCDPGDGVDISDLSALIDYLYISFTPLCCDNEANVDGDPQGGIDISDLSALIDYLYISFTPPSSCL